MSSRTAHRIYSFSIQLPDGTKNVPVGKVIALLAEEGDDISNLEPPKEEPPAQTAKSPTPPTPEPAKSQESQPVQPTTHHGPPSHTRPLFPSVHRLVLEHGITNLDTIKGTGVRGMLTKGDILTYLGKASGPTGTYKPPISPIEEANKSRKPSEKEVQKVRIFLRFDIQRLINVIVPACSISPWMVQQFDA